MVNFFDWLDEELEQRNWVRADLARRAKISESGLSMAYSRKRGIGPNMLKAIAGALKIPEETVFQAYGTLSPKDSYDPWLEEQQSRLKTLTGERRRLAEGLLKNLQEQEEEAAKLEEAVNRKVRLAEK